MYVALGCILAQGVFWFTQAVNQENSASYVPLLAILSLFYMRNNNNREVCLYVQRGGCTVAS